MRLHPGEALPGGACPVLVARSSARGLAAAAEVLTGWHPAVARPWLVLVADAPAPPPPVARYRASALVGQVRGVVAVRWLWPLRGADHPDEVAGVRVVARAAVRLRRHLDPEAAR